MSELNQRTVRLRQPQQHEAQALYQLMTDDEQWTLFNGPYFGYQRPSFEQYLQTTFAQLMAGEHQLAIDVDGRLVGAVNSYWESEATRWLEAGVVIYDSCLWNQGIGRQALVQWVSHLFALHDIERVGMATWSGNPRMIRCALANGFTLEGTLRRARYYQGVYYDAVRLGVLREEWQAFIAK